MRKLLFFALLCLSVVVVADDDERLDLSVADVQATLRIVELETENARFVSALDAASDAMLAGEQRTWQAMRATEAMRAWGLEQYERATAADNVLAYWSLVLPWLGVAALVLLWGVLWFKG